MRAVDGCGWAQLEFGDRVGQDGRYIIARKLGWPGDALKHLARSRYRVSVLSAAVLSENGDGLTPHFDSDNKFVAVKMLTGHVTDVYESGSSHAQPLLITARDLWTSSRLPEKAPLVRTCPL